MSSSRRQRKEREAYSSDEFRQGIEEANLPWVESYADRKVCIDVANQAAFDFLMGGDSTLRDLGNALKRFFARIANPLKAIKEIRESNEAAGAASQVVWNNAYLACALAVQPQEEAPAPRAQVDWDVAKTLPWQSVAMTQSKPKSETNVWLWAIPVGLAYLLWRK